jgi:hypothetical protein
MTLKAGVNGALYLSKYDLSGVVNKFEPSFKRPLIDGTCMGAAGRQSTPGLYEDSFTFDAFYDLPADIGTELTALRTATAVHVCSLCLGTAQGEKAVAGEGAWAEDLPMDIPVDGLIRVAGSFKFEGLARTGIVLHAKATATENGNGAVVTDAAATTAGAEAYLHVFSCTTATNLVVKVQTDTAAGFSSPTDLITFTAASAATSERKTVTGAVERYVRVSYSATWGGSSASFAVIWARL